MFEAFKTFTEALNASDVGALGRAGLDEAAGWVKRARSALDAYEARLLAAANRACDGGAAGAELMRTAAGCSQREARRRARRAEVLAEMPAVAGALAQGTITAEHADSLVKAAEATSAEAVDDDSTLLAKAKSLPADLAAREVTDWTTRHQSMQDREERFRRQRQLRSHRTWTDADGMFNTRGRFDPDTGAHIRAVIDDAANRLYKADGGRDGGDRVRTWDQRNANALTAALGIIPTPDTGPISNTGTLGGGPTGNTGPINGSPTGNTGADWHPATSITTRSIHPGRQAGETGTGQHPATEPASEDPIPGADTPGRGVARGQVRRRNRGDGAPVTGPAGRDDPQQPMGPADQDERQRLATGPASRDERQRLAGSADRDRPNLSLRNQIIVIAHTDAITGADPAARCEIPGTGPIPRSELERLACQAELFGILFDRRGLPLWHGQRTRTVSPQQWRALIARDRGCVLCGAAPSYCHAHHIVPWSPPAEGPTDIDNLVLVCNRHHHHIHQHDLTLTRHPDGGWSAHTPDQQHRARPARRPAGRAPAGRNGHIPPAQAARSPTSIRAGP